MIKGHRETHPLRKGSARSAIAWLALAMALALPLGVSAGATPKASAAIRWEPCSAGAMLPRAAKCGWLDVAEDRAAASGRRIALRVIVSPAIAKTPAADPVFFLAGGPGQGAAALAQIGGDFLDFLRKERTLVFMDQRGTGASHALACDLYQPAAPAPAYAEIFPLAAVRTCRDALSKTADLRLYGTAQAVEDLDALRSALGAETLNLLAGSYGTIVAQEYLRRHPLRVRSVALESVAGTDFRMPLPFARAAQSSLEAVFAACDAAPACAAAFPRLPAKLAAVLTALASKPAALVVEGAGGAPQQVELSRDVFAERLRLMLYSVASAREVPYIIDRAAAGDFAPFAARVAVQLSSNQLAFGMYFSVTCAEALARISEGDIGPATAGTFLGEGRVRAHQKACVGWPLAAQQKEFFEPIRSTVPALLLSGALDPATPPQAGTELLAGLPNGRQVLLPAVAHAIGSPCVEGLVAAFIESASADHLDLSCVSAQAWPPFKLPAGATAPATTPATRPPPKAGRSGSPARNRSRAPSAVPRSRDPRSPRPRSPARGRDRAR